jgi:hypothetical protein
VLIKDLLNGQAPAPQVVLIQNLQALGVWIGLIGIREVTKLLADL